MDSLILGLRVLVALGAVLGLMWFLQRRLGKGTGRRRADRALTVVSRQPVGQKASVVVVDTAGQRFLLGVTEHSVNVLHTGDIPVEPEEARVPEARRSLGDFARILAEASPLSGSQNASWNFSGDRSDEGLASPDEGLPEGPENLPLSRRGSIHRGSYPRGPARRGTATGASSHPPMHGSIFAGSTWKQAAAALRGGRRN